MTLNLNFLKTCLKVIFVYYDALLATIQNSFQHNYFFEKTKIKATPQMWDVHYNYFQKINEKKLFISYIYKLNIKDNEYLK